MLSEFINFMRGNLNPKEENDSTILKWLELALGLSDDGESKLDKELSETMDALEYVKSNFKPEVFQQSLRFCTLSNEIIYGALCFNAGYSLNEVEQFATDGLLECGYMPTFEDETGSFTVVHILPPEDSVVVFNNVSEKMVLRTIGRASNEAAENGGTVSSLISKGIICGSDRITRIINEPLKNAFLKGIENSTAVKQLIEYNQQTGEIVSNYNQTELHIDTELDPCSMTMN